MSLHASDLHTATDLIRHDIREHLAPLRDVCDLLANIRDLLEEKAPPPAAEKRPDQLAVWQLTDKQASGIVEVYQRAYKAADHTDAEAVCGYWVREYLAGIAAEQGKE